MRPIKIGIIGCGKVAHFHAKAINNLLNCCLVAACNHSEAKLQNFCETYKINGYLSPEEMIEKEHLEEVTTGRKIICGPLDAIVRPIAVAPCTSDLHTCYEGGIGERTNMFLGHEAVGDLA